ncbi:DegT/DnrJ/EryC1/StrS family aminotransferase [Candidatus Bathyarchaeota archaeon]|nr:DegT/DnrJ/EryC1/StrS family aminotransferase [Candidatus Bathyarchaeota archaeon]
MSKLAIEGGTPVAPGGLRRNWPIFSDEEKKALLEVLESGRWWRGAYEDQSESKVGRFETEFCKYLGVKYGVAVTNGTAAIELALKAAGVEAGDEVIVPAVTFIATATAVLAVNAVPIFVDIDPETYQIDPEKIEEAITDKTKAIVPVHYGGYPADMDRIMEIAEDHDLIVVEDCAEAHGSEWRGKKVGGIGHLGTFSFQMGKPLTCGEGGFVSTNDEELAKKCFSYHNIGRVQGRPFYEHHIPAWNLRMTEFQGAILLCQLKRLPEQTEKRYVNGEYLAGELEKIGGIRALKRDPRVTKRGYYFYLMRYNEEEFGGVSRDMFLEALRAEGIPAGTAHNQPLYKNPVFVEMRFGRTGCPVRCPLYGKAIDYTAFHCPVAERVYEKEIVALGKDFLLSRDQVDLVLEAIRKIKENIDELRV